MTSTPEKEASLPVRPAWPALTAVHWIGFCSLLGAHWLVGVALLSGRVVVSDLEVVGPAPAMGIILGVFFAQASLIAVWTALGPLPLFHRLGVALLALTWVALVMGIWMANEGFDAGNLVAMIGVLVSQWFAVQIPLWVARIGFHWHVGWPDETMHTSLQDETQFGIRQLLVWTAAVAMILTVTRYFVASDLAQKINVDNGVLFVIFTAFNTLAALPAIWAALARRRLLLWIGTSVVTVLLIALVEPWFFRTYLPTRDLPVADMDVILWWQCGITYVLLLGSLLVARACGCRLILLPLRAQGQPPPP